MTIAVQVRPSFQSLTERAIATITLAMRQYHLLCIGCSYGKDSSTVLGLTLEAARRLKQAEGTTIPIRVLTADTRVENPSMIRLAHTMSEQMLGFAQQHGLDVEQQFVQPPAIDRYLSTMIGGRGTASVPGTSATCTTSLKIRPMEQAKKALAEQYGAENIVTLIGTRFQESAQRGRNMTARGENAIRPVKQPDGSALLSPIADWALGDVWGFLNASERILGFPGLDYSKVVAVYETIGESTCSIGAIDPNFQTQASGGCGSAGRTGCWACQRVSRDSSLESMLVNTPAYEPLVRLSRTIRAGHYLPENRSFLGKTLEADGRIRVFSNGYSAQWTEKLLSWTLSVDFAEDDYAEQSGKPRRFPRLLAEEDLLIIAFQWARYGLHTPGAFIRIYHQIASGARVALPSDQALADMRAKGDQRLSGKTLGWIQTGITPEKQPAFQDHWRDQLGADSPCAVATMTGRYDYHYHARSGVTHDSLVYSEGVEACVDHLTDPDGSFGLVFMDFMSWYALEFASGRKSHADELNWLLREGIIRARPGYQSRIALYQQFTNTLASLKLTNATLDAITQHPAFQSTIAGNHKERGAFGEQLTLVA